MNLPSTWLISCLPSSWTGHSAAKIRILPRLWTRSGLSEECRTVLCGTVIAGARPEIHDTIVTIHLSPGSITLRA